MEGQYRRRGSQPTEIVKSESDWDVFVKQCREFFRDLDTNDDGRLDRSEFITMIQRLGLKLSNNDIQKAFNRTDKNRDGSISFREFVDYYSKELCLGPGPIVGDTKEAKGSSGSSRNSAEDLDKKKRDSDTDKILIQCRNYFRDLDTDGNGTLDKKEFALMLSQIGLKMDVNYMRKAFGHVDKDANGGITFREFVQYYNIMKAEK